MISLRTETDNLAETVILQLFMVFQSLFNLALHCLVLTACLSLFHKGDMNFITFLLLIPSPIPVKR